MAPKAPVRIETKKARKGPRIGDHARGGKVFQHSKYKKVKAPPRGQEYRIIDDRVVLVNKDTLRIIAIIGMVSALTR